VFDLIVYLLPLALAGTVAGRCHRGRVGILAAFTAHRIATARRVGL
jgi:hypothetical protein